MQPRGETVVWWYHAHDNRNYPRARKDDRARGHPQFLCASAKGAGKVGARPVCGNCRGKGHEATACTSKGGGKHTPKGGRGNGKGSGGGGKFGSAWGKCAYGKGKGKGKGKISEFDDAGWANGGAAAEWNWAAGSD